MTVDFDYPSKQGLLASDLREIGSHPCQIRTTVEERRLGPNCQDTLVRISFNPQLTFERIPNSWDRGCYIKPFVSRATNF